MNTKRKIFINYKSKNISNFGLIHHKSSSLTNKSSSIVKEIVKFIEINKKLHVYINYSRKDKDNSEKDNSEKDNSEKDKLDNSEKDKLDNSEKDNSEKDNSEKDKLDNSEKDKLDNSEKDNSEKDNSEKDKLDNLYDYDIYKVQEYISPNTFLVLDEEMEELHKVSITMNLIPLNYLDLQKHCKESLIRILSENERILSENDSKFLENDSKFLENDSKFLENDSKFLENDSKFLKNDSKFLENDDENNDEKIVLLLNIYSGVNNETFCIDNFIYKQNDKIMIFSNDSLIKLIKIMRNINEKGKSSYLSNEEDLSPVNIFSPVILSYDILSYEYFSNVSKENNNLINNNLINNNPIDNNLINNNPSTSTSTKNDENDNIFILNFNNFNKYLNRISKYLPIFIFRKYENIKDAYKELLSFNNKESINKSNNNEYYNKSNNEYYNNEYYNNKIKNIIQIIRECKSDVEEEKNRNRKENIIDFLKKQEYK